MKILHVIDQISQEKHGGSAKVPYHLAKEQVKLGHEVTIFASDYQAERQQPPAGAKLVKYNTLFSYKKMRVTPSMILADWGKTDVIHLHNYRTFQNLIACNNEFDRPVILQAHGSCLPITSRFDKLHSPLWRRLILNRASHFIADAEQEYPQYVKEGADPERISVIPVGIDLDEFTDLPEKQKNGHKTVLFLGRLDYNKGLDLLVKAFAGMKSKNTMLHIAGVDYGYWQECLNLIQESGIKSQVKYIGNPQGEDKKRAFVEADVFAMPSRYETWGITFMEALACGTPVVLSDRSGAASLLPSECGAVTALDINSITNSIEHYLSSIDTRIYRDYRRNWVKQFGWDKIANQVIKVYEGVLDG